MQSVPDFAGMTLGGRYHLVKLIGHGGMATVYEALDVSILKRVAVKVLSPHAGKTDDYLARFRQEALGAAQMKHPHLIDVTDFGIDDGLAFLVMELLEGEPLSERLDVRSRMLPWREAVSIILPVCEALAFAHERGLIHRDIKPGNIFLAEEPGRPGKYTVKLLDLGIAKALPHLDPALRAAAPETRATQGTPGTPEYMSPEQVLSEAIDHRVDIYALGVTLYRMLTGDLPFSCPQSPSPYRVQRMHVELPPVSLRQLRPEAQIPEAIEAIVLKALAKRPEERQSSAQELAAALLAAERAELGMPEPTPMIIQERGRDGSRTGFGPSQPRLLTLITVLSGFLTSAAVFMLCMLGPLPGVNAFANMLRGPEGAPPPRTRRAQADDTAGSTVMPTAGPSQASPPRSLPQVPPEPVVLKDAKPEEPPPAGPAAGGSPVKGPTEEKPPVTPKKPRPNTGQDVTKTTKPGAETPVADPKKQAQKLVQARVEKARPACKQIRPQQIKLQVDVALDSGKIQAKDPLGTKAGACMTQALNHQSIKPLGAGTASFDVWVTI